MEPTTEKPEAPGLRWKNNGEPIWRASKEAARLGYSPKNVPLSFLKHDQPALLARCNRLQQEMLRWLNGDAEREYRYDGSFASLIDCWQKDPDSDFHKLKRQGKNATHAYDVYIPKLTESIGERRVQRCHGGDLKNWFAAWRKRPDGKDRLAAARVCLAIVKAAVTYGETLRLPGCHEFGVAISKLEFPRVKRRKAYATAAQLGALRRAAHRIEQPRLAFCFAIQFETVLRQYDVAGAWRPLDYAGISSVVHADEKGRGEKWLGPTWANIDKDLILTWTPSKTEHHDEAVENIRFDLKECPMVMEELARIPVEERKGPLIVGRDGVPYQQQMIRWWWRQCAEIAGLPKTLQNRDLRASGITEADQAGSRREDRTKQAGHKHETTTTIYERETLDAHRRNAAARKAFRAGAAGNKA